MDELKILEEYFELRARDSAKVSAVWKILLITTFCISAITGYLTAMLFVIFWVKVLKISVLKIEIKFKILYF